MNDDEIRILIKEKQNDSHISCRVAMDIAERAGVSTRKVGELLNEMKIKIGSCQLGCFK